MLCSVLLCCQKLKLNSGVRSRLWLRYPLYAFVCLFICSGWSFFSFFLLFVKGEEGGERWEVRSERKENEDEGSREEGLDDMRWDEDEVWVDLNWVPQCHWFIHSFINSFIHFILHATDSNSNTNSINHLPFPLLFLPSTLSFSGRATYMQSEVFDLIWPWGKLLPCLTLS